VRNNFGTGSGAPELQASVMEDLIAFITAQEGAATVRRWQDSTDILFATDESFAPLPKWLEAAGGPLGPRKRR